MVMKRLFFAAVSLCAVLLVSCDKNTPVNEGPKGDGEAGLLTYGFYQSDNAGLTQDYIVNGIAEEMVIRLPEGTDKTALVARFTTTEGDKVMVGQAEQISGTTANDFTYPVDYIVTDESSESSARYTVKVGKILGKEWALASTYADGSKTNEEIAMCISPKDNNPYFFLSRVDAAVEDAPEAGAVACYDGTAWTISSDITYDAENKLIDAKEMDIAIDADGKVYVMYYNSAKFADGSYDRMNYVWTGSGSSWSQVGNRFGAARNGGYQALEIDPATGYPIVSFMANAKADPVQKRDLDMCYFDGAAWSSENLISDVAGRYVYNSSMRVYGETLYLAAASVSKDPMSYFVFRYEGANAWTKVIDEMPAGVTKTALTAVSFAVAGDGTIYLCAGGDEDTAESWYINVYKCAPGATAWTRVSTAIKDSASDDLATSSRYCMDLYNDLPVVVYKNQDTGIPEVVMLNAETKQWDEPVVLGNVGMATGSSLGFEFSKTGVGYVAFLADDGGQSVLQLYKYDTEKDDLPE